MRLSLTGLGVCATAAAILVQVAAAMTPSTATSVHGMVIFMRGNSVRSLSSGDKVIEGDRVITSGGARVTFANGVVLGSGSSLVVGKSPILQSSSSKDTDGNSKSGKSLSGLFDDKKGGDRKDDDDKNSRDDDHDGKGKDRDGKDHDDDHDDHDGHSGDHDHDDDCPWEGDPKTPHGVSD